MPRLRIKSTGGIGIISDVASTELPENAWTDLYNVICSNGKLYSAPGERKLFDLSVKPVYHMPWMDPLGAQKFVISDGEIVHLYNIDGTHQVITPAGGLLDGEMNFSVLNGVLVANSVRSGPFYYDPVDEILKPLPGWDSSWRCEVLTSYKYYLVALNMTEGSDNYPHKIRWSSSAEEGSIPTLWVPAASNDAGDDILGETQGRIVGGVQVRDSLIIVKDDSLYSMDWIGLPYVMQTKRLSGSSGTRNRQGYVEFLGSVATFSSSDLLVFDGTTSKSIVTGKVRNKIFQDLNQELWDDALLYTHIPTSSLYVVIPSAGKNWLSDAWIYDWNTGTWGHKSLQYCIGFDSAMITFSDEDESAIWNAEDIAQWNDWKDKTWNKGVHRPSTPDIIIYESNDADTSWWISVVGIGNTNSDGSYKTCRAIRTGLPVEGVDGLFMLKDVWPEVYGDGVGGSSGELFFSFGSQMSPYSSPYWELLSYSFIPGQDSNLDPWITGRFLCMKVESNSDTRWELNAITLGWERAGER